MKSIRRDLSKKRCLDIATSYLFIMPVILGIALFTLLPMLTSLWYSFHDYMNFYTAPVNFGFQQYVTIFTSDFNNVVNSLKVTFLYTAVSVPLTLVLSFSLAMFLNNKLKGIRFFRMLYYTPALIPAVVSGLLWSNITQVEGGLINLILQTLGLPRYTFFSAVETVLPSLLFMGLFGLGGGMVLWLAQLKSIPEPMYEAAMIEGAGFFRRTFTVTIPMCTPMIFYNLVLSVINSLQTFSSVYLLITPLNGKELDFFVVKIYSSAFTSLNMAYACALSWILFCIIAVLTFLIFRTSKWVFYGEDV